MKPPRALKPKPYRVYDHDETQGDGLHGDPDQEALRAKAALDLARRYLGGSR